MFYKKLAHSHHLIMLSDVYFKSWICDFLKGFVKLWSWAKILYHIFIVVQYLNYLQISTDIKRVKVQFFWEGHKNLRNLPYGFDIYGFDIY